MSGWPPTAGACLALTIAVPVAVHAGAYLRARHRKTRVAASCPFEDDDHEPLSWMGMMRAVAVETLLLAWAVVLTPLTPAVRRPERSSHGMVALIAAPGMPRGSLWLLAARLARDGWTPLVTPLPARASSARALARLASVLERLQRRTGGAPLDVVTHGGAGVALARALQASIGVTPRRVIVMGGTLAGAPPFARGTDLVTIYSLDDPWLPVETGGRHPAAFNVVVRGEGHQSILAAPRVYELVRENLEADTDDAVAAVSRPAG